MKRILKKLFTTLYFAAALLAAIIDMTHVDNKLAAFAGSFLLTAGGYFVFRLIIRLMIREKRWSDTHTPRSQGMAARALENWIMPKPESPRVIEERRRAYAEAMENKRKAYARYKAKNDIVYHRTRAERYAGTRDGYKHECRMWDAIKRSKQY